MTTETEQTESTITIRLGAEQRQNTSLCMSSRRGGYAINGDEVKRLRLDSRLDGKGDTATIRVEHTDLSADDPAVVAVPVASLDATLVAAIDAACEECGVNRRVVMVPQPAATAAPQGVYFAVVNRAEHLGTISGPWDPAQQWPRRDPDTGMESGWTEQEVCMSLGPHGSILTSGTEAECQAALDEYLKCEAPTTGAYCYTHNPNGGR